MRDEDGCRKWSEHGAFGECDLGIHLCHSQSHVRLFFLFPHMLFFPMPCHLMLFRSHDATYRLSKCVKIALLFLEVRGTIPLLLFLLLLTLLRFGLFGT